jgi:glycine oxidase
VLAWAAVGPMSTAARRDLVVVGGGIIGLAIAYEASRRGLAVLLVERERLGGGATAVAGGMLAPVSEGEEGDPRLVELCLESARLYPEFVAAVEADAGLACGYRTEGTLLLALDHDHREQLEQAAAAHRGHSRRLAWLTAQEVKALEPRLAPRALGAFLAEEDRQVDPRALAAALAAALARRGVAVREGATVAALEPDAVELRGAGGAERVAAGHVVLCAGAWCNEALPGLPALPLRPVRGQIVRLRGEVLIRHVVRTPDVYLVPRADGELLVGATSEERGFDPAPTAGAVLELLGEAFRAVPGVAELAVSELTVGFRPALRDHLPAIGATRLPGVLLAAGHYRNGVLLAPVTARLLVEGVIRGAMPEALAPFSPARFEGL